MNYWISILPIALGIVGGFLTGKDSNTTGGDDKAGELLTAIAPEVPGMIAGKEGSTDKAMLAAYKVSRAWLESRGKLPQ